VNPARQRSRTPLPPTDIEGAPVSAILRALAILALLALVLAACAEEDAAEPAPADEEEPAEEEPAEEEPAEEEPAEEPAEEEPADEADGDVAVGSTDLGDVLVDGEGMTLYLFEPDDQGDSTCYDDCAQAWPPLLADGDPVAGEGADEALLGTVERDDGSMQVTYDGWPLYHWSGDEQPGDTNGQGIQDVWWVVAPDGTPDAPVQIARGEEPWSVRYV
jgi:predicted lipoprotein with Yx(FWY)xxD motif